MKLVAKFFGVLVLLIVVLIALVEGSFRSESNKLYKTFEFQISEQVATADLELGKRIYNIRNGCIDCHGEDLAGKMVMDNGAMGTIWGANITPATLGNLKDEEIAKAIRYGVHHTGRSLRFMPSFDFEGLSMGDMAALIKYIRSVPSKESSRAENTFGPIAKMLSFLGKMPVMFPAKSMDLSKGFAEKPAEGPTVEFGQYLANSCIGCHGPNYQGGKIPGGDPSWPEAANIRFGANSNWSEEKFEQMIKTGTSPISGQKLKPPMPIGLLAQMNPDEIKALWLFLKTLN